MPRLQSLIFALLISACCFSQSNRGLDSLATQRYHEVFDSLIHIHPSQAKHYVDSLQLIAVKNRFPKAAFYHKYNRAYHAFVTHDIELSIASFREALDLAISNDWKREAIDSKLWLGNHYNLRGESSAAQPYYTAALQESKVIDYTEGMATGYFGLASLETDHEKVLKLLIKIDSIYQNREILSPVLTNSYTMIGEIYLDTYKDKATANKYFEKAIEVARKVNYLPGLNEITRRLGAMAFEEGDYQTAYKYYKELYDRSILAQDTINLAHSIFDLAGIDYATDNFKKAEDGINTAITYFIKLKDSTSIASANLTLANLNISRKDVAKAKKHLDQAMSFPKRIYTLRFRMRLLKTTIDYLELTKDFETALQKQQELDSLKTLQLEEQNSQAFVELEQQYRANEKEQEVELLTTQNELIEQQNVNQRNLFLGGGAILTLAVIGLFLLYRNKQKTNERLKELDAMRSNFFANISHEFRTPLTLISGPIQQKLSDEHLSERDRSDFERIHRNNKRLLELVDQLLDLSKIEAGSLRLQVANGNILRFVSAIADSFSYQAEQKQIQYLLKIDSIENDSWFDKDAVEKILVNLLSNAIKYTSEKGSISCSARIADKLLVVEVRNTGKGLSQAQLKKVFERFYQVDQNKEGTGIGLALAKELVSLHKGTISAKAEPDQWISFSFTLPLDKQAYNDGDFQTVTKTSGTFISDSHEHIGIKNVEQPVLLIVEDNYDLRAMLYDTFENNYNVITAGDGHEGVQQATQHIPDLIISDVMMPKKDGISLTKELKGDERTSHIPIILLTAKAGEENELVGIETGADDYITKPFNHKILTSKVAKLIELRQLLQSRYSQEVILKPKDIAITNLDEQFLEKVQKVLDKELLESSFTIEQFSQSMTMSRMQLHRKLKALTGLSATEFVRSQRLKLAAQLLKKSGTNISQVGYSVGFNDPSYFSRCFKEAYLCTPSEYANQG